MTLSTRIIRKNELDIAIKFLAQGFNWNSYKANRIRNFIKISNNKKTFLGYFLIDPFTEKLYGAILTILQGSIKSSQGNTKEVINLSAWYVKPSKRGIPAILFAENVIKDLIKKNYLITDYTPTPLALKIFKRVGLLEMNFEQRYYAIWSSFNKLFFNSLRILISSQNSFSIVKKNMVELSPKGLNLLNVDFYEVKIKGKKFYFAALIKDIKTKRFGIYFNFPVLQIVWIQNENIFLKNLNMIRTLIHVKFKVLFIFSPFKKSNKNSEVKYSVRNFLIDKINKEEFNGFIYPIGSELCIK